VQPDGRVILQHSMASLSLKSGALTGLRAPAASCVCFSAKPEPICSFNPHSLAPNAAIRLSRRCRLMPASFSMTARAVANGSSPSRAIAACSALTAQCRARRHRATCVAACRRFIKCLDALKSRTRRRDRQGQGGPVRVVGPPKEHWQGFGVLISEKRLGACHVPVACRRLRLRYG